MSPPCPHVPAQLEPGFTPLSHRVLMGSDGDFIDEHPVTRTNRRSDD